MRRNRLAEPGPVLFACLFASQAALMVLSPILSEVARELGTSTAGAGQLRTVSGLAGGIVAVLIALAARRPSRRALLSAGATLVAAGSAASAAAPTFALLAAAQAVIGAGIGLLIAVGLAAAGDWSTPEDRPRTLAWAIAGMPAAWVVGMPVVGAAASAGWRLTWLVPAAAALAALALLRRRPAEPPWVRPRRREVPAWRRPEVVRFAAGELPANAAWAGVLTYVGSLLIERYGVPDATVAVALALTAAAMIPGTVLGRRGAAAATPELLVALTLLQAGAVAVLGLVRAGSGVSLGVLAVMAFVNGWRSMVAGALGMESAPDDKVAVMGMRAAGNQFGYLLGAAAGGAALALGGFGAVGVVFAALFALGTVPHLGRAGTGAPIATAAPDGRDGGVAAAPSGA